MQGGGGFDDKKGGGLSKAFESWSKKGELTKKIYKWNAQQGNLNVYKTAKKNVQVETELNHAYYEQERRKYWLHKQTQKNIDDRIKEEIGWDKNRKSLTKYLAKLTSVTVIARRLGRFFSGAIKESANYVENLNLFAVAYGKTYQQQIDWALNLADVYGLASNEVLRFAGTFRELSSSLGLVGDTADLVTKTVTNLGYDLSALFNTTVENAMEKLQSGIFSGNVRPLRAYGIDISQNQIDALFETNEALKQLGVNARNLSQSDKVIARLIITLQSGKDSFGTMAREINNLQSQFRIFQGSIANFKLAIGDSIEKPLSKLLVFVNAVIISMTNVMRTFLPLQKTDETPKLFTNTAMGAEEAEQSIEELEGKLAGFDKFNVLQSNGESSNLSTTEALNKLLEQQANLYEQDLTTAMKDMENQAKELASKLQDVVFIVGTLLTVWSIVKMINIIKTTKLLKEALTKFAGGVAEVNKGLSFTNILLVTGIIFAVYKAIKAFKEGDTAAGILATTMAVALVGAWILFNREMLKSKLISIGEFFVKVGGKIKDFVVNIKTGTKEMQKQKLTLNQVAIAVAAMAAAYLIADSIINSFGEEGRKTASICFIVAGGIMAVVAAALALTNVLMFGTALPFLLAGVGAAIAGVKGLTTELKGFADGGYTNANLIMTHENGKREWVGKAAGSSAIVNDTQMSDIMEGAVAKGVYQALTARSAMGSGTPTNETIVVKIGEEAVFNAVRKTAKRQGRDFANI
jgi:hypothetical protein